MDTYRRRISSEEEREGYILVETRALAMFPPVGEEFALGGRPTRVRTTTCTCRGEDDPHEHYVIDRDGVRRGQEVVITRLDDGEYGYR
ncbi:MAG TPA: hypothetical protein VM204_02735 [Gaiellaceae bacterium]|nr:hypothetical protein [Gaiellaceae bacterium]